MHGLNTHTRERERGSNTKAHVEPPYQPRYAFYKNKFLFDFYIFLYIIIKYSSWTNLLINSITIQHVTIHLF